MDGSIHHDINASYIGLIDVLIRGLETAKQHSLAVDEDGTERTFCAFLYGEPGTACALIYYHA